LEQTRIDSNELSRVLCDTSTRWRKLVENRISALGLVYGEFRVLWVVGDSGTCSMVKLAKEQSITQAGMTSIVDRLENQKLIERIPCKTDRRVINIRITRKGRSLLERAFKLHQQLFEKATHDLTRQEIKQLVSTLNKMLASAEIDESPRLTEDRERNKQLVVAEHAVKS
jgi:MarR family 2-MHQ and catechol resistance regulon transcriptional repressor